MRRPKALYVLRESAFELTYGEQERARIARLVDVYAPPQTTESVLRQPGVLVPAEVLLSGWGGPLLDATWLDASPCLEAVFYGAGSVSRLITDAVWERDLVVTTAQAANAIPVAEYALAMIVLALKQVFRMSRVMREIRRYPSREGIPGCFRRLVGLVSLGATGRALLERLRMLQVDVVAYDPFVSREEAARLGVDLVPLEELFARAQVVSIHTPHLAETEGMITGSHLHAMPRGASLINTARGALIREEELIRVAVARPDLQFILDVTNVAAPDDVTNVVPPSPQSPLYDLPNVFLTPHIAGSIGEECRRMGQHMVDELQRYIDGEPLQSRLTRAMVVHSCHRTSVA
jgi:phosphoglycerate dehydrogenase-like enzyme